MTPSSSSFPADWNWSFYRNIYTQCRFLQPLESLSISWPLCPTPSLRLVLGLSRPWGWWPQSSSWHQTSWSAHIQPGLQLVTFIYWLRTASSLAQDIAIGFRKEIGWIMVTKWRAQPNIWTSSLSTYNPFPFIFPLFFPSWSILIPPFPGLWSFC